MNILYIYSHPDDESFGPAAVMHKQLREGHKVYLLTLTRGGATKQRHKFNYSIEEMGEVRYTEMLEVEKTLGLSGMTVLDFPDSGLKELDPRDLEDAVAEEIEKIHPQVIVSYPVHGISGFHDHIITHAVVKRVFLKMKTANAWLRRLAFVALTEAAAEAGKLFNLSGSTPAEIDASIEVTHEDVETGKKALDCYATYQETIAKSGVKDHIASPMVFEIFQEEHDPPLADLVADLPEGGNE